MSFPRRSARPARRLVVSGEDNLTKVNIQSSFSDSTSYRDRVLQSGLSWVEFHRLANRVIDALDPYKGTGHLYTQDEIDRNCLAREILAEELPNLLANSVSIQADQLGVSTIKPAYRSASKSVKTGISGKWSTFTPDDISMATEMGIKL